MRFKLIILLTLIAPAAYAGSMISPGDFALRHDIQRLADFGAIKGTVTTWPLAWGPVLEDLEKVDGEKLPADVKHALDRVLDRARWETRTDSLTFNAGVRLSDNSTRIRSFQDTPRGRAEVSAGLTWVSRAITIELNGQAVDQDGENPDVWMDGSMIGAVAGNWSISANTHQRWWGPGWDSSLILSNNARPMPSITIDRVFTDAFETRWLSWLGPWDLVATFGQMEKNRAVPDAQFFGLRFNFRPLSTLEIGLTRTAQWCGDGRPCSLSTFGNLLIGRDNVGDDGTSRANEPGNQLAGVDFRWSPRFIKAPFAVYGQFIGEDEAGGFPSRFIGQAGLELSGYAFDAWSYRAYAEFAGTSCQFYESSELFNCAYNHSIYTTGYRYRGRSIGHSADNDSRIVSVGAMMINDEERQWRALLRYGKLNRGGPPDSNNSLTSTPQDVNSLDLTHSRVFSFGMIELGVGYERLDDIASGQTDSDTRAYLQWRSSY